MAGFRSLKKIVAEMKMNRIGKVFLYLAVLMAALFCASAAAEAKITFSPENPRMGDYVDVTVKPGREGAAGVRYELSTPAGAVFTGKKESTHYTASFRPREEAVYTLTAVIVYGKNDTETVSVDIPVSGTAPAQEGPDVVYSQKDGWWHKTVYSKKPYESLEKGGCAIFSLSHILQRLGYSGEEVQPAALASANSRFYIQGRGTDNGGLLNRAAENYNFVTQEDLILTEREAALCLRRGDLFSFGIVLGHIAMVDGVSEDGTLVHVVDSASGATFERKNDKRYRTNGHIYWQAEDGSFKEAETADQLPGIRWFFETGEYGGMSYWMDLHYCLTYNKHAGLRLIRRPWLEKGGITVSQLEYTGTAFSRVKAGGDEAVRVPTKELSWATDGADSPQIAVVTNKKGANLVDGNGKALERYAKKLTPGTMMAVLAAEDDLCYVFWKDTFCFIARDNVDLLPVRADSVPTGLLSTNGRTAGTAKVVLRATPKAKGAKVAELTIGTPVAILETGSEYTLVEGKGYRGWIMNKYLTPDAEE